MKERQHPAYNDNKDLLQFYEDSFLGGDPYITSNNLHKHRLESRGDFKSRLKRSFYLNYCETVVKVYTQYTCPTIMKRTATEGEEDRFKKFYDDCTGDGTDLPTFIRDISNYSGVSGYCGVLIDGTHIIMNAPATPTAEYDKNADPPRLRKVTATQLVNWSVDSRGQYNWILIKSEIMFDSDPTKDREILDFYELWDRNSCQKFTRPKDKKNEELTPYGEKVEHNLGVVPFCMFVHTKALLDGIPASQLKDIALVNRAIYNYCSNLDDILAQQTFSQLLIPELEEGEANERVIGTKRYVTYNALSNTPPSYIAPPNGPAEVLIRWIQSLIAEIFRLAIVRKSGAATTDQYSTAYGKAVDFEDTEAALREKADLLESCEYNLAVIVFMWLGNTQGSPLWTPFYPKKFDVRELTQTLTDALQFDALGMGPKFMAVLKSHLVKMMFPDIDESLYLEIVKNIEKITEEQQLELPENATVDMGNSPDSVDAVGNPKENKRHTERQK